MLIGLGFIELHLAIELVYVIHLLLIRPHVSVYRAEESRCFVNMKNRDNSSALLDFQVKGEMQVHAKTATETECF